MLFDVRRSLEEEKNHQTGTRIISESLMNEGYKKIY